MLVGSPISPMYEELVRRRQLVLGISHWEGPGFAYPNLFTFQAATRKPHSNREVLEAFDEIIEAFKNGSVDEDLLEMAKRQMTVSYLGRLSSNMSLALEFASAELVYNDWIVMLKWFEEAMAVTPDDIGRVARHYLNPATRTIGMIESEVLH
jgi:predicted Zn-dependent peptidase